MATKVETFDTREERNARWEELRKTEKGISRFSGIRDTGARKNLKSKPAKTVPVYVTTYSVGYYVEASE